MDVNKTINRFIKIAFKIMLVLLLVYATIGVSKVAYDFGYRVFTEPAVAEAPGEDVLIQIKEGMSAQELGQMLEEKGLVRDGNLFYLQLKLSAYSKKMEPGVYTLNTSMTAEDMMVTISDTADQRASEEAAAATQEAEGAAGAEITQEADVPASEGE